MKKWLILILIMLMIIGCFLLWPTKTASINTKTITINNQKIIVEIADTPAKRERGLSGRESLPPNTGLLFVFDEPGQYGFWMKDMLFPIDILWLDENFQIVGSWLNADPTSYPKSVTPKVKAKYVLETNLGEITH